MKSSLIITFSIFIGFQNLLAQEFNHLACKKFIETVASGKIPTLGNELPKVLYVSEDNRLEDGKSGEDFLKKFLFTQTKENQNPQTFLLSGYRPLLSLYDYFFYRNVSCVIEGNVSYPHIFKLIVDNNISHEIIRFVKVPEKKESESWMLNESNIYTWNLRQDRELYPDESVNPFLPKTFDDTMKKWHGIDITVSCKEYGDNTGYAYYRSSNSKFVKDPFLRVYFPISKLSKWIPKSCVRFAESSDEITKSILSKRVVNAIGGVKMRTFPDITASIVVVIPDSTKIDYLEEGNVELSIGGKSGRWTKVKFRKKEGWVFGGFLRPSIDLFSGNYSATVMNTEPGNLQDWLSINDYVIIYGSGGSVTPYNFCFLKSIIEDSHSILQISCDDQRKLTKTEMEFPEGAKSWKDISFEVINKSNVSINGTQYTKRK